MSSLNTDDVLGNAHKLDGGKKHRRATRKQTDSKKIVVGKIYAEWCGACKALAPEWKKMDKILSKKRYTITPIEIEEKQIAQELPNIKQQYGVEVTYSGYPTIFTIEKGQVKYYNGQRTAHEMANWFMSGGQESTASNTVVPGLFGGRRRKFHRKTEKVARKKPVGFLGFFFGHHD